MSNCTYIIHVCFSRFFLLGLHHVVDHGLLGEREHLVVHLSLVRGQLDLVLLQQRHSFWSHGVIYPNYYFICVTFTFWFHFITFIMTSNNEKLPRQLLRLIYHLVFNKSRNIKILSYLNRFGWKADNGFPSSNAFLKTERRIKTRSLIKSQIEMLSYFSLWYLLSLSTWSLVLRSSIDLTKVFIRSWPMGVLLSTQTFQTLKVTFKFFFT